MLIKNPTEFETTKDLILNTYHTLGNMITQENLTIPIGMVLLGSAEYLDRSIGQSWDISPMVTRTCRIRYNNK